MQKVLVIGCAGAGKSTLARQLGEKLDISAVHLDSIFWLPGWIEMEKSAFDARIREELAKEKWIMDGNYNRTLPERIAACDTVVYLDFSRAACLFGVLWRFLTNIGKTRPDMGRGCKEKIDGEFLVWIWNFNKSKRARYYRMLGEAQHARVIILKNRRAVRRFLREL